VKEEKESALMCHGDTCLCIIAGKMVVLEVFLARLMFASGEICRSPARPDKHASFVLPVDVERTAAKAVGNLLEAPLVSCGRRRGFFRGGCQMAASAIHRRTRYTKKDEVRP
jgi:hypothetical protein